MSRRLMSAPVGQDAVPVEEGAGRGGRRLMRRRLRSTIDESTG